MDFANYWFSGFGGEDPGPGPGFSINNSLRFRGNQSLERSFTSGDGQTKGTISYWIKRAAIDAVQRPWSCYDSSAGSLSDQNYGTQLLLSNGTLATSGNDNSYSNSIGLYRDPAAWYHIVTAVDTTLSTASDRVKVFVNGDRLSGNISNPGINSIVGLVSPQNNWKIRIQQDNLNSFMSDCYLAEMYFIHGQALEPTDFGNYSDNGVWVPAEYTGTYGTSGFHLDFSDPNDIGADRSGNGNDFTATGFDTSPPGIFSNDLYTSTTPVDLATTTKNIRTSSGGNAAASFNNDNGLWAISLAQSDNWFVYRPSTPFANVTSLAAHFPSNVNDVLVNGVSTGQTFTGDRNTAATINLPSGFSGTLETLAINVTTSPGGQDCWAGLLVNGQRLVDNIGTDYDLMQDSPTQNWATLNPNLPSTDPYFSGNYSNANQIAGGSGTAYATSGNTIHIPTTGKWYAEVELINTASYNNSYIGIASEDTNVGNTPGAYFWGMNSGGEFFNGSTDFSLGTYENAEEGDIVGIAFDSDTNLVQMYKNGVLNYSGTASNGIEDYKDRLIFLSRPYYYSGQTLGINFGQRPFVYSPPDEEYLSLQTQNLPAAPIANGRDHFQAITGPGTAVGDPNFNPATDLPGDWSVDMTCPGGFHASNPAANVFDGNNATSTFSANAQGIITFTPQGGLPFTTTVAVRSNFALQQARLNGGAWVDLTKDGNTELQAGAGTIQTIDFQATAGDTGVTSIHVDGKELTDVSVLAQAQIAFPNGLWWIKDRVNSNQHQLVNSVNGTSLVKESPSRDVVNYTAPAGSSVAWCWSAPDAFTDNTGTISSTGARNVTAGFSINTYTGTGLTGQRIGHGLNEAPEFMMSSATSLSASIVVYHKDLATNSVLQLTDNGAAYANSGDYPTRPDANFVYLGGNPTNFLDRDYVLFAWHSIPGYSAFGSYEGNGNADGPFVYTGMRVAFLLVKNADGDADWRICDSTRSPFNPTELGLFPNKALENPADGIEIDFLSNGFKLRSSAAKVNQSSKNYVYAAFAENPLSQIPTAR